MAVKHCSVYLWRCTTCGSKHYGKNPPFECKKCSADANRFILIPKHDMDKNFEFGMPSLNSILYLVGTILEGKVNAMCCSSVTQLTYHHPMIAVSVNKNNLTHDFIKETGAFSLCLLGRNQSQMAHDFGRNSGRKIDKFESYNYRAGKTGSPIVEECSGFFDCKVDHSATIELVSHTVFVGEIIDAIVHSLEPPLTYFDYLKEMSSIKKG